MAHLTAVTDDEARRICGAYGLAFESLEALPALGTVNSNFRLRASGRVWFLRVNEGKRAEDVAAEVKLLQALGARGVPTPQPVGEPHALGEKFVTLFPWVPGRESHALADSAVCGQALRLIHAARLDGELPRNHYTLDELERRLATFLADARFAEVAPALGRELSRARQRHRGREGLIHQDLFPDNLLVDGSGQLAAVLDFEQATRGPLVYDLAVSLNAFCWDGTRIVKAAADALLTAYGPIAERALLEDECRLAAARFTITRITDVFLPDGVDEDLRRRKDWRDYARRLAFWSGT
jgi:homoserine kinase type II